MTKFFAFVAVGLATAPGSWRTFRHDHVSIRYPRAWYATSARLTPVTGPAELLAVASYPPPSGDRGADGCEPEKALAGLPRTGTFIYALDYGDLRGTTGALRSFPRRPRHFSFPRLFRSGCLGPSYIFRFRQASRFFQVYVVLGTRATRSTRSTVLRVLDSLQIRGG